MATKLKLGTNNNWATKVDKLLAYNDENGNFKPIEFDADRSSTSTRVNKAGLVENVEANRPRVQFSGNNGYLLLEPTRTNLQVRSEEFDNSHYTKTRCTITANDTTSPDGTQSADKLVGDGTGTSYVYGTVASTSGTEYSISVFVKKINVSQFKIQVFPSEGVANFDIENGTNISISGAFTSQKIEDYGNGWYRCSVQYVAASTATKLIGYGVQTYNGEQFYLWGAQNEAGSYPTSYIPTSGSAVTRTLDNAHLLNQTLFTNYPFTVYAKAKLDAIGNTIFSLNNTSSQNYYLAFYFPNSTQIGLLRRDLSLNDSDFYNFSFSIGTTYKIAVAFVSATAYKLYINGTEIADVTSGGSIPFNHDDISLGQFRITGDTGTRNSIDEFIIYNEALSDAELKSLTS